VPPVPVADVLAYRLAVEVPGLRPPAAMLQQVAERLGDEEAVLVTTDLQAVGFGAYAGQLCIVTPTRVLLVTATGRSGEGSFAVEEWRRAVAARRAVPVRPREARHDAAEQPGA